MPTTVTTDRMRRHLALGVIAASGFAALGWQIVWTQQAARQWSLAFCGTLALLLPATAAIGATLPAMERVMAQLHGGHGRGASVAALYAGNTLGAVLGVSAAAFWLVPHHGLAHTAAACAALNLLCAAAAIALSGATVRGTAPSPPPTRASAPGLLARLAATGLLGIGYEVLVVRTLSQVTEGTVYTFAMLLAVYLAGSTLGAAAYRRWLAGSKAPDRLRDRLLCALAAACLSGTLGLWSAEALKTALLHAFGGGMAAALAAEAAVAAVAFLLPTVAMGAVSSHLGGEAVACGIGLGRALGINTLGAALAPLLFGVGLLPALGLKPALLIVAGGYLALSSRRAWSAPMLWGCAAAVLALALWAPPLAFVDVPDGGRVVSYREGPAAAVSVVEDAAGVARLRIDNRQQEGDSASRVADARQALLPLLLHPAPRRALFLGLGTGVTAASAAEDPALQVDAVELLPEVVDASATFTRIVPEGASRLHVVTADARRFVRAAGPRYDLIVSDNFHPARSGSGSLYTVEHFEAVRRRLAAGGLFCQWLPLHQLDLGTLRSIVRSFLAVYPGGSALLATHSLDTPVLGLLARGDGGSRFDLRQVRERLRGAALPRGPAAFGIHDDLALLGSFVAGPRALDRFAGDAHLNTDDRPVVAYAAPRIAYAPDSLPRDRLIALLGAFDVAADELVDASSSDAGWPDRLKAYRTARDRFVEAGRDVRPTADVRRMLAQVREPLLAVLRISPDFRPAYDPLLRMAVALGRTDAAAARALLAQLEQAQPARPEAARALHDLAGPALYDAAFDASAKRAPPQARR